MHNKHNLKIKENRDFCFKFTELFCFCSSSIIFCNAHTNNAENIANILYTY